MLLALSLFLAILSVVNKLLLAFNKKSGWTSGILIGLISAFYFSIINLRILSIAELGFFLVMFYGYLTRTKPSQKEAVVINIIISSISIMLCYYLFVGYLTVAEVISSLSFIWGGYLLTSSYRRFGWLLFTVAHASTYFASSYVHQYAFAYLQIASALVCAYALFCRTKKTDKRSNCYCRRDVTRQIKDRSDPY